LFHASDDSAEKEALLDKALTLSGALAAEFPSVAWNWSDLGEVHALLGQWQKAVDAQT
jgi:hypothetical protein